MVAAGEPTYYTDANLYGAARWVHVGAAAGPGQAVMRADGTFTASLDIDPRYVDGNGREVDCTVDDCHVITMAAHGSADRSQDTFTPVSFGAEASGTPPAAPATRTADDGADMTLLGVGAGLIVGLVAIGAIVLLYLRRRPGA